MNTCRVDRIAAEEYVRGHGFHPTEHYCVNFVLPRKVYVKGVIWQIEYVTRKDFEGQETFVFFHDFEGDQRPLLATGQGRNLVVGGGYTVTPHGIEDLDDDPRKDLPEGEWTRLRDYKVPRSLTGLGTMYGIRYEDEHGKRRRVSYERGPKHVLAYNPRGAIKTLYVVPVSRARRVSL